MAPVLVWLILFLCLLISVIKYTLALILKFSVSGAKVKKDYTYQPTVSVLMPCYNEGQAVYESIKSISQSNYSNEKFEVIAQDGLLRGRQLPVDAQGPAGFYEHTRPCRTQLREQRQGPHRVQCVATVRV